MKQTFLEEKMCLKLLNSIPLINYDEHTRWYSFNPMFDGFILKVLDEMPVDEVTKIHSELLIRILMMVITLKR